MSQDGTEISRVIRSKEEARDSYNKMSKWYDTMAGRSERKYREKGLQKLSVREGEKILEIGFGTGHCVVAMAQSVGDSGKVYGVDLSEGMLNITLSKVAKARLTERVNLVCGDAAELPFGANFFNAILMSFILELFDTPEIPTVLQECQRVLQNDGRICVVALSKKRKVGVMVKLYERAHSKFPNFVDCRPIFAQKALEDAKFQILDLTEMSIWGLPVDIVLAKKP